jgi:hypothetical protein
LACRVRGVYHLHRFRSLRPLDDRF